MPALVFSLVMADSRPLVYSCRGSTPIWQVKDGSRRSNGPRRIGAEPKGTKLMTTDLGERTSGEYAAEDVRSIISRMTLAEKIALMSGRVTLLGMALSFIRDGFRYNYRPYAAGGCRRLGLPEVRFADGPRGCVCGRSTCFPVAMARAASWDIGLEERIGRAIGAEVKAQDGNLFGGVCINLLRHPAWGRAQETFGEDPFLLGEMGAALVRGVQDRGVMACVKHYAANSIEDSRFWVDVTMDERTLREVYLPHFHRCVRQGAASVMGAYNKFRGDYCCQNKYLLRDILKSEWGFSGFTISDFVWGVRDTAAAEAGMDIEMPFTRYYGKHLKRAVKSGLIDEGTIDAAAARIIGQTLKYAGSPRPGSRKRIRPDMRAHANLAAISAEKSMVLLKNDGAVLPFDRARVRRLAVIGALAAADNLGDHGSSRVRPPYAVTILEGLKRYLEPSAKVIHYGGGDILKARAVAGNADAVVLVAGYRWHEEGENITDLGGRRKRGGKPWIGGDRTDLALNPRDVAMIKAATQVNKQTAVVLICGSAVIMEEWIKDASAVLLAWYPGMEGGSALARIIFGEANPSGKLPLTIPKQASDLPPVDTWAERVAYGYYHDYSLLEKTGVPPAFAFGFGLSYTTFAYEDLRVARTDDGLTATVAVTNVGGKAGEEVVQLYVGFSYSQVERPLKLLRGFAKVNLKPGEKTDVTIQVNRMDLAWYDPGQREWLVEEIPYLIHMGGSSRFEHLLTAEVTL